MKKILVLLSVFLLAGCQSVTGDYKEGTYYGSLESVSYGKTYVSSAVVYVDNSGEIKSVFIDSTYFANEVYTTKKTLKDAYGMKETSASVGNIPGGAEWDEQVVALEKKIVEEQGTSWVTYKDDKSIDSLAGCTIVANDLVEAVNIALKDAKK